MRLEHFFAKAENVNGAEKLLQARAHEMASSVTSTLTGESRRLYWQGEITAGNAETVWNSCRSCLIAAAEASYPEIVIDLSAVRFIDSSGLGVMVRIKKLAQRHGTRLVFTALQPAVLNVLQLSRMEDFLLGKSAKSLG
jgi:anti-anti-sigma factor